MRWYLSLGIAAVAAAALAAAGLAAGGTLHAQPGGPRAGTGGQSVGVPLPRFADALPSGFELRGATAGLFVYAGDPLWAVAWTQPGDPTTPPMVHLGVIQPHATAPWELIWSDTLPTANPDDLLLRSAGFGVPEGFALSLPDGAHSSRLLVYRWDGASFMAVFDRASALPDGVGLSDLPAETSPMIVRAQPALCFHNWADGARVVTVFRWDGGSYLDATAAFPSVVDEMADGLQAERTNNFVVANATPAQQACFSRLEAYIARLRGDAAGAAQACAAAQALAPGWSTPEGWEVQAC